MPTVFSVHVLLGNAEIGEQARAYQAGISAQIFLLVVCHHLQSAHFLCVCKRVCQKLLGKHASGKTQHASITDLLVSGCGPLKEAEALLAWLSLKYEIALAEPLLGKTRRCHCQ